MISNGKVVNKKVVVISSYQFFYNSKFKFQNLRASNRILGH